MHLSLTFLVSHSRWLACNKNVLLLYILLAYDHSSSSATSAAVTKTKTCHQFFITLSRSLPFSSGIALWTSNHHLLFYWHTILMLQSRGKCWKRMNFVHLHTGQLECTWYAATAAPMFIQRWEYFTICFFYSILLSLSLYLFLLRFAW